MSHRGHGDSDKPPGEENYSVPIFADDIHTLLRKLDIEEKVIMMGHSMGGRITQQYCLSYPEEVKIAILFATLTGPKPTGPSKGPWLDDRIREIQVKGVKGFLDDFVKLWFAPGVDPQFVKANTADSYRVPEYAALGVLKSGLTFDLTDRISAINIPVLVIVGGSDQRTPVDESEKINRLLPNSWLKIIKGAGHMAQVEKTEEFNRTILDFLKMAW
jgi:pimeloyl-ACP methyl ester carboxylesterase